MLKLLQVFESSQAVFVNSLVSRPTLTLYSYLKSMEIATIDPFPLH